MVDLNDALVQIGQIAFFMLCGLGLAAIIIAVKTEISRLLGKRDE